MSSTRPHAVLRPGSRLWPIYELLRDRGQAGATTLELSEILAGNGLRDFNISSSLADIRKTAGQYGYEMLPAVFEGKRGEGASARKLYRYRLVKAGQGQPATVQAPAAQTAMASSAPAPLPSAGAPRDLYGDSRPIKW